MAERFADIDNQYQGAKGRFTDRLLDLCPGLDFTDVSCDPHDSSIELHDVPPACHLNQEVQEFMRSNGFDRCWLRHSDGHETYYHPLPSEGERNG